MKIKKQSVRSVHVDVGSFSLSLSERFTSNSTTLFVIVVSFASFISSFC